MTTTQLLNGIDTKALGDMIDAVKKQPAIARSTFRVATELKGGFAAHSTTKTPTLGGAPIQGGCIGSGFTTFGAAMGIPIERVTLDLTGYLDLQGFMGLPAPGVVRPGYERIHAAIRVKSRAPRAELEKLKEIAEGASPVKDSLRAVAYTSELIVEP